MKDSYSLPPFKARICRVARTAFLLCAAVMGFTAIATGLLPGARMHCGDAGCAWSSRPSLLLEKDVMVRVQALPSTDRAFTAYAARPEVRAGIVGVTLIETGPFAVLLLGVGIALRRLGGNRRDALARALPWLRRASQAAIVWAIARPVAESLMDSLLSAGTPAGAQWKITVDVLDIGTALMLGIAAYATVWALEGGLKAQRDLDDFV